MSRLIIGLMSGTSLDGTDALAMRFSPEGRMTRLGRAHRPFPADLRETLFGLATARLADEIERAGEASVGLADEYAETVLELLRTLGLSARDVTAIAVHGQTVRHRPEKGFSLQLNHPARLAERTGIDVLCDFRARDIAAGGQGAPLVPAFHRAVFAGEEDRAVLNVGGIANVTILTKEKTEGFDTGPGNMLLDAWCQREKGEAFDRDGAFARKGRLLPELLDELLSDPYFTLPPTDTLIQYLCKGPVHKADLRFRNAAGFRALGVVMEDEQGVSVDNYSLRGNSGMILEDLDSAECRALNRLHTYDLIVLQYGLNIANDSILQYGWYGRRMEKAIRHVRACFPTADILLMGVSDRSRQESGEFRTMPSVLALLHAQRQTAKRAGIPFWNTFGAMGGRNSMVRYVEKNWASKDYTHLGFGGGRELSRVLMEALLAEMEFYEKAEEK